MMRPTRRPSEADNALWSQFTTAISPLAGRRAPAPPKPAPTAPPRQAAPRPITAPLAVGLTPAGVDRASWQRFRTGKLATERRLDLHGRTAQRAFQALNAFIRTAHAEGVRCVEIVTGRGSGETGGVLRRELPFWLNQPDLRPLILAASHPHAANPGSVRLLLRRVR